MISLREAFERLQKRLDFGAAKHKAQVEQRVAKTKRPPKRKRR